jgi:hypothetical protein
MVLLVGAGAVTPAHAAGLHAGTVPPVPAPSGPFDVAPSGPFDVVPLPAEDGATPSDALAPGAVTARSYRALDTEVDSCPGAPLPAGYGVEGSIPYSTHTPTGTGYNPQGIVLFMRATWTNELASEQDRRCLLTWAAAALDAGSRTQTFTDDDGKRRVARLYPYPYTFSANPSMPDLTAYWVSGLAQGSVLTAMSRLYQDTHDATYLGIAEETFNSFLLPMRSGGFVTDHNGLTYLQEYVTRVPSYVLNGHNESVAALIEWARLSGDPEALKLARRTLASLHATIRLEEISFPTGVATSYDLLRGWPASQLRVVPLTALTVHAARIVEPDGTDLGAATLAVQKASGQGPELLTNAAFTAWSAGGPTGWAVIGSAAHGGVEPGTDPRSVRIRSDGAGHVVVQQTLPKVTRTTRLTVSWTAQLARTVGVDSTPGDVVLQAVCGLTTTTVAAADVRSPIRAQEGISGEIPSGCLPRVKLYQADGAAPSDVTYADVSLRVSDPIGTAQAPAYPMSVLDVPDVSIRLAYSGSGWLQGWWHGRWTTVGFLGGGSHRTATVAVPAYMQGRTVNLRYHNAHVAELTQLYEATGDTVLRDRALAWLPYAPAMERYRARLTTQVSPNPLYADLFS